MTNICSLEKSIAIEIREFEKDTGLAVRTLEIHRTGASDNPPDEICRIHITLSTKYNLNEKPV
jgi:hypothetical protein